MEQPYRDSRRLTGPNLYFAGTGAALETLPGDQPEDGVLHRWRANIDEARRRLGWPSGEVCVRRHADGASLAFEAPLDQLYVAAAVNEWAWCDALGLPLASDDAALDGMTDRGAVLEALQAMAGVEANPRWVELDTAATQRRVPCLADDDVLTLGAGAASASWPMTALPEPAEVAWPMLRAMPVALVTGSNGKTTTVRLLAAMLRAHGWPTTHSCTDGVFFDGGLLEAGDWSGPGGARAALRHPQARAAVLETARGGLLRRGLAIRRADAAIVTNVSADHFGKYGIHDLADLARAKLVVARAIDANGLLVANADDALLRTSVPGLGVPAGWFGLDAGSDWLRERRAAGESACAVHDGRLQLSGRSIDHDLGEVAAMPLTAGGRAAYNIANAAAAALAAFHMGVPPGTIARTLARFGGTHADNPGRLQHWRFGEGAQALEVVVDYAHNAGGLAALFDAVGACQREGRLGLLLGHAGNRLDGDLRALADAAATVRPDRVWLKDIGGDYLRGKASGEVASRIGAHLRDAGVPGDALQTCLEEDAAARAALAWAQAGDLLVLPLHEPGPRARVNALLQAMQAARWQPGMPLPD